ncbi:MAG: hypothetical protein Q8M65_03295, partial [Rhodoglobus sp.]|nr:hypothetical protein [Rhodoglobus sp.]
HTWRQPSRTDRTYFAQIAAWGYPLSEVEQIVVRAEGVDGETVPAGAGGAMSEERTGFDGDTAA